MEMDIVICSIKAIYIHEQVVHITLQ